MACEIVELFQGKVSEKDFGDLERVMRASFFLFFSFLLQVEI
jgi:hypothetical protein